VANIESRFPHLANKRQFISMAAANGTEDVVRGHEHQKVKTVLQWMAFARRKSELFVVEETWLL